MRSSNLAYALRQEAEVQPQQAPVIRKLPKKRPTLAQRRRKTAQRTVACVAYFVMVSAALIYGKVQLTEQNTDLVKATESYAALQSEYTQLQSTVNNMASLQDVEDQARALGLGEMRPDQIETIVVSPDNSVEVKETSTGLAAWWDNLMTYIFG